jgi:hypothetical protein
MSGLSAFPITKRWPAKHPERLQLYSPRGVIDGRSSRIIDGP